MKRYFWNTCLKIFLLTVVVIAIQSSFLFIQYHSSQTKWQKQAYEDFVSSIEESIKDGRFSDLGFANLSRIIENLDDQRISGCVLRSMDNKSVVGLGFTPKGEKLGSEKYQLVTPENITRVEIFLDKEGYLQTKRENLKTESITITVPSNVHSTDIVGSLVISTDHRDIFAIDLLAYNPRYYEYSKDILNSCLRSLMFAICASLVISAIASWTISKRNTKIISDIRTSLQDLAKGNRNLTINHEKQSFLNDISLAIEDLDKALSDAEKSKMTWLNGLSHELNTPATGIKIMIEGINTGAFPKTKKNLQSIEDECDQLIEKIKTVMEISSTEEKITEASKIEDPMVLFEGPKSEGIKDDTNT